MTTPANDEAALAATVEARAKELYSIWFYNQNYENMTLDEGWEIDSHEIWIDIAANYAALSDREARLRAFVEWAATHNIYTIPHIEVRLKAAALLSAIGGESEVGDG